MHCLVCLVYFLLKEFQKLNYWSLKMKWIEWMKISIKGSHYSDSPTLSSLWNTKERLSWRFVVWSCLPATWETERELSWLTYFSDGAKQSSTAWEKTGLLALLRQHLILQDGRGQARPSPPALEDEILILILASNWQWDFSSVLTSINRVESWVITPGGGNIFSVP